MKRDTVRILCTLPAFTLVKWSWISYAIFAIAVGRDASAVERTLATPDVQAFIEKATEVTRPARSSW